MEGQDVTLTAADEDTDRYGRLLRYVDVGTTDAGLRPIKNGRAVARYDSRDGYGFHRREPLYVAADQDSPRARCAEPAPAPSTVPPAATGADGAASRRHVHHQRPAPLVSPDAGPGDPLTCI